MGLSPGEVIRVGRDLYGPTQYPGLGVDSRSPARRQRAITAHFSSEQLRLIDFALRHCASEITRIKYNDTS